MQVKIFDFFGSEYIVVQEFAEDFYTVSPEKEIEKFPIGYLWESNKTINFVDLSEEGKDYVLEAINLWNKYIGN